jgi:hypothetical protein
MRSAHLPRSRPQITDELRTPFSLTLRIRRAQHNTREVGDIICSEHEIVAVLREFVALGLRVFNALKSRCHRRPTTNQRNDRER